MADDGSSLIAPTTAGDLKKNAHAILNGFPCKIMDISKSKTGKHGHAKCSITGVCVLTGKKIIDVQPAHAQMYSATVQKVEYQLIGVSENGADLLDENSEPYNVALEGEVADELKKAYAENENEDYVVTVLTAPMMDANNNITKHEVVCAFKKADN